MRAQDDYRAMTRDGANRRQGTGERGGSANDCPSIRVYEKRGLRRRGYLDKSSLIQARKGHLGYPWRLKKKAD